MLDKLKIQKIIKGKTILVTGGTGSFGKTIASALLKYKPQQIRIYSRGEDKQEQMKFLFKGDKTFKFILGDVRDKSQLERVMKGVDYVFHAAAQKQVPGTEINVLEGVKTNVFGAQNVIDVSIAAGVKKAIAISTDKAVEPINAMGMTKALQERLFIGANTYNRGSTVFSCVRYGNVLGSTGSVLPLFLKQLKSNEPLTITHKEMTRFLITLDEAVNLVLEALIHSVGGEIFIPDIQSHSIIDLSDALYDLFPLKKGVTKLVGIRPGEKLHETLISPNESLCSVKRSNYYIIYPITSNPILLKKHSSQINRKYYRYSSDTAKRLTRVELKSVLSKNDLVKEAIAPSA